MQIRSENLMRALALAALAFATGPAAGQPITPNGCGTGWNRYLVPDSIKLAGCTFKSACDSHDICYGLCEKPQIPLTDTTCVYRKCRKNGDLFGQALCEGDPYVSSEIGARKRKVSCDGSFYNDLRMLNKDKTICEAFSALYLKAVEKFGLSAFAGVAPPDAKEGELPFSSGSREAIERFFDTANDEQLRRLIQEMDKPNPAIDLTKPLMFVPGAGLRNDVVQ